MNVLFFNYCLSLFVSSFTWNSKVASRYAMFFMFVCIFFLHAFANIKSLEDLTAYSWGFDEIEHMTLYECITTDVAMCKMERGFALLLKIFSLLGLKFRSFLIVNALFISIMFYRGIQKYSPSIILSTLLFLLILNNQSIYVIRQYIVVAVFFYSLKWIVERKMWKYIAACILCFFIHQSSIILIPVFFLYHIDIKKFLCIMLIMVVLLKVFLKIVVSYFVSSLVGYGTYANFEGFGGQNPMGFYIGVVYLLMYVLFLKEKIYKEGINRLLFICAVLNCILLYFGIGLDFAARLSIYFSALNILLVPIMLDYVKSYFVRIAIITVCLSLNTVMTFYGSISIEASHYTLATLL